MLYIQICYTFIFQKFVDMKVLEYRGKNYLS